MDLLADLEEHVVWGDDAMGTLLLDRGVPVDDCLAHIAAVSKVLVDRRPGRSKSGSLVG
jgi:hypothetical protein